MFSFVRQPRQDNAFRVDHPFKFIFSFASFAFFIFLRFQLRHLREKEAGFLSEFRLEAVFRMFRGQLALSQLQNTRSCRPRGRVLGKLLDSLRSNEGKTLVLEFLAFEEDETLVADSKLSQNLVTALFHSGQPFFVAAFLIDFCEGNKPESWLMLFWS